jgi:hypothetical protein
MSVLTLANPRWATVGRAAKYLGVAPLTVRRMISSGRLSVRRIPFSWPMVSLEEIDRLEAASTELATEESAA